MPRIGVVDYGMGNLRSVLNAFAEIEQNAILVSQPEEIEDFDAIVIPGVGAFAQAMESLRKSGMAESLDGHVAAGKPLLGICLGMQLICRESSEGGQHTGLGWIDAKVSHFPSGEHLKIPHMGWNAIEISNDNPLVSGIHNGADVYFVHSYYVDCADKGNEVCATVHGLRFASVIARENVYGMQFHPEKSQAVGMQLLRNFAALH